MSDLFQNFSFCLYFYIQTCCRHILQLFVGWAIIIHVEPQMSLFMRKQDFYLCKIKGEDQLCSNCTADQRLCFRLTDSTIPLLLIPKFQDSSFLLGVYRPVSIGPGRKPKLFVFSWHSSNKVLFISSNCDKM